MLQVVFVIELRGVYEDAHDDGRIFTPGALHERAVSRMEGTHRGDEPDPGLLRAIEFGAKLFDACKYFHLCKITELRGQR